MAERFSFGVILLSFIIGIAVLYSAYWTPCFNSRARGAVTLDKEEYGIGGRAILTVRNVWKSTILTGVDYGLYRNVDGSWVWVPVLGSDTAWTAAARVIRPGESHRQVIKLDGLQAGEYRLRKVIHHTDTDEMRAYYVGFTISG